MRVRKDRGGFTLIELLVVITIISVLMALLLPAISSSREAGRRAQCQSNLHNLSLGLIGFANTYGKFPAAGVITDDPNKQNGPKPAIDVPRNQGIVSWMDPLCSPDQIEVPLYNWVVETLPYLDQQELYNGWSKTIKTSGGSIIPASYLDTTIVQPGQPTNYMIGSTPIGVLRCPDDLSAQPGQGNLSYVVNGGFSLWPPLPMGWISKPNDGESGATSYSTYSGMSLASSTQAWSGNVNVAKKMGVMFLEDYGPYGASPTQMPWNVRTTFAAIVDGASSTILLSESTLAGASSPGSYSRGQETNWACPLPNFCMFFGPSKICGDYGECNTGGLQASADADGTGWAAANQVGTYANINYGQNFTVKGSSPFSSSGHPSGCNMAFCDGAVRFIPVTIDGTVYSKIITPAGSKLPPYMKQFPVAQDAFAQ